MLFRFSSRMRAGCRMVTVRQLSQTSSRFQPCRSIASSFYCSQLQNNNSNNNSRFNNLPRTQHIRTFTVSTAPNKDIPYLLADIGEGIAEAEVLQWFVSEGDKVEEFDRICEVQSDKATVEISSRYDGVIKKLLYEVGDMALVGKPFCSIEVEGEAAEDSKEATPTSTPEEKSSSESTSSSPAPANGKKKALASPAVRRICKENNIELSDIIGTGKDGLVLKSDVQTYLEGGKKPTQQSAPSTPPPPPQQQQQQQQPPVVLQEPPKFLSNSDQDYVKPIRGIQRMMVKSMNKANTVPHFGYADELCVDKLIIARQQLKPLAESRNVGLSYMPFFIKAVSLALRSYPEINAHINDDCTELTVKADHNISIAMDTPTGLLVPNVKCVQNLSIFEIACELNRLQIAGKAGKLSQDDLANGTISLSNIGSVGGTYMSPVLVVPQIAIAALGKFVVTPRYDAAGAIVPSTHCNISWSGDHRVVDGATMARFSNQFKLYLENPQLMLLDTK